MSVVPETDELPAPEAFDALIELIPTFEDPAFSAGMWIAEEGHFPWFHHSSALSEFVGVAYGGGWVVVFDWMRWEERHFYEDDPTRIATADVATIRRLITTAIRADRFAEGYLGGKAGDGSLLALLHRVRDLRMPGAS